MAAKKPSSPAAAKKPTVAAVSGGGRQARLDALKPHQFKPGQSGNPLGGKLQDPELKLIKNLTKKELVEIGNLVVKGNMDQLRAVKDDPDASVIKTMIAAVAMKVIAKGDMGALDVLLNRLVGKVKDEVEHSGAVAAQVIVTLPSNGREAKAV